MNRYYVEMEHPRGKEDYGTFYIYMMAYDAKQIIDMIDGERNEEQSHHYYKQGYDFGLTLYNELYGKDWESE